MGPARGNGPPGPRPQRLQREHNISRVMAALRKHGEASRSELAAQLGLDRSTLTHLANELLSASLIVESHERTAGLRGGRRPRPLKLNPDRFAVVGIDVRAGDAEWVLLRLDGSVRSGGLVKRAESNPTKWLEAAARQTADHVRKVSNGGILSVLGVGVSIPGVVDQHSATVRRSIALGLEMVRIDRYFAEICSAVHIDNDANCCAWNLASGPGGRQHIIVSQVKLHRRDDGGFLPSGAGIGLALVLNGSVYYGTHGAAGELRGANWTVNSEDQLGLHLDESEQDRGPAAALRALALETLRNLSVVVSVLDPDLLVITGDVDDLNGPIQELLHGELAGTPVSALAHDGLLTVAPAAAFPPANGAAQMVLSKLFELPSAGGADGDAAAGRARASGWTVADRMVVARVSGADKLATSSRTANASKAPVTARR